MDARKLRYVAGNTAVLAGLATLHEDYHPDTGAKVDQVVIDAVETACKTIADFIATHYEDAMDA